MVCLYQHWGQPEPIWGQMQGHKGEETVLSFEAFPNSALSKTYCVNSQVADSACSATAYLGGVKGNIGTIGVTGRVAVNDCEAMKNTSNQVSSVLQWSQEAKKATGVVTTTTVTHASPAGAYAHVANRNWENNNDVNSSGQDSDVCDDIAEQLVNALPGKNINVILGGGRKQFRSKNVLDEEGEVGSRTDDADLIESWRTDKESRKLSYKYVWNKDQLLSIDPSTTDYILGLFDRDHMPFHLQADSTEDPTLEEMTRVAINTLSKSSNGFFLFVEGGRIDHGHHGTQAHLALDETVEFAKAIQAAVELTNETDTLIVVTADHAHTMTYNGYPVRGNDIFGVAGTGNDGLEYTTLSYANGPGYKAPSSSGGRHDISGDDLGNDEYRYPATFPLGSETHGGDDVAVFARGPWSHLFSGSIEQNYIPHAMAYASCVGDGITLCTNTKHMLFETPLIKKLKSELMWHAV
ncbi:hypothetical protein L9F63_006392, partial [Diploptera punctata]